MAIAKYWKSGMTTRLTTAPSAPSARIHWGRSNSSVYPLYKHSAWPSDFEISYFGEYQEILCKPLNILGGPVQFTIQFLHRKLQMINQGLAVLRGPV